MGEMNTDAERLAGRLTGHYTLVQMAYWVSFVCVINFAAVILGANGFESSMVGTIIMLAAVASSFLQSWLGELSDRVSALTPRRITVAMCAVGIALALFLWKVPVGQTLKAILYVLVICDIYSVQPFITSMCFRYANAGIPVNFGLARGLGSVASACMSFMMGTIIAKHGPNVSLLWFAGIYAVLLVVSFAFLCKKEQEAEIARAYARPRKKKGSALAFFKKYRRFCLFLLGIVVLKSGNQILFTYMNRIVENVGGTSVHLGHAIAIASVTELPVMAFSKQLIKKFGAPSLLKFCAVFFLVKAAILTFSTSVGMIYFGQSFQMLSFALLIPVATEYCNQVVRIEDQVTGQALTAVAINTLSSAIGTFTGGILLQMIGLRPTLYCALTGVACGVVIFFLTAKRAEEMQVA